MHNYEYVIILLSPWSTHSYPAAMLLITTVKHSTLLVLQECNKCKCLQKRFEKERGKFEAKPIAGNLERSFELSFGDLSSMLGPALNWQMKPHLISTIDPFPKTLMPSSYNTGHTHTVR